MISNREKRYDAAEFDAIEQYGYLGHILGNMTELLGPSRTRRGSLASRQEYRFRKGWNSGEGGTVCCRQNSPGKRTN